MANRQEVRVCMHVRARASFNLQIFGGLLPQTLFFLAFFSLRDALDEFDQVGRDAHGCDGAAGSVGWEKGGFGLAWCPRECCRNGREKRGRGRERERERRRRRRDKERERKKERKKLTPHPAQPTGSRHTSPCKS